MENKLYGYVRVSSRDQNKARGELSARQAASQLGITHKTFLRWAREEDIPLADIGEKSRGEASCVSSSTTIPFWPRFAAWVERPSSPLA